MSEWAPKRFWTDATVTDIDGGYTVLLDKRAVKTPAKAPLALPTEAMAQAGVSVHEVMNTNSFTLLRQMVESGIGIGIVFGRFLQIRRERISFVELQDLPFESPPVACCRMAGRTPTASSVAFGAAIRTIFVQYGG